MSEPAEACEGEWIRADLSHSQSNMFLLRIFRDDSGPNRVAWTENWADCKQMLPTANEMSLDDEDNRKWQE